MNIREELNYALNEGLDGGMKKCFIDGKPENGFIKEVNIQHLLDGKANGSFRKFDLPFINTLIDENKKITVDHIDIRTKVKKKVEMIQLVGRQIKHWCKVKTGQSKSTDYTKDGYLQE